MKNIFHLLLFTILIVFTSKLQAQEKVLLRTDRDIYIAGEKVWFAANCIADSERNDQTSAVVYVELLNDQNIAVKQLKVKLQNGSANTFFTIPDTIATGNYLLRSYTKWMKNYNEQVFFNKTLSVVNPFVRNRFPKTDKIYSIDTLFCDYPGKSVIQDVPTTLIIRSVSTTGKAMVQNGQLVAPDDTRFSFKTNKNGIAKLALIPTMNGQYYLTYAAQKGAVKIPVFVAKKQGYNIAIENLTSGEVELSVVGNQLTRDIKKAELHLATANGKLLKQISVTLSAKQKFVFSAHQIPSNEVLIAYLIDTKGEILSSRYFVQKPIEKSSFSINTDKQKYGNREVVKLSISKPSNLNDVSVSISKAGLVKSNPNIKPNYLNSTFFNTIENLCSDHIRLNDLLICFNPLEQFLSRSKDDLFLPELKDEIIFGTLKDSKTLKPLSNVTLAAGFVSDNPQLYLHTTNDDGQFLFEVNEYGVNEMVIQPFKGLDIDYTIDLEDVYSSDYGYKSEPFVLSETEANTIAECITNMQIESLYEGYAKPIYRESIQQKTGAFYGDVNFSVSIEKFIDLPNMEEIIHEIIPMVVVRKENKQKRIFVIDEGNKQIENKNMVVLVDGIPIYNHESILKIRPNNIEKIDVVSLNYFKNDQNVGRVLSIFTKSNKLEGIEFDQGIFRQEQDCYRELYQFIGPNYGQLDETQKRIPDYRNMLYWNPNLSFDKGNYADLTFYTSDESTSYQVVVEGINEFGSVVRTTQIIEVK